MDEIAFQHWSAPNDTNGNPRRLWVTFRPDGGISRVVDEGYSVSRGTFAPLPELPGMTITATEYRETLKAHAVKRSA